MKDHSPKNVTDRGESGPMGERHRFRAVERVPGLRKTPDAVIGEPEQMQGRAVEGGTEPRTLLGPSQCPLVILGSSAGSLQDGPELSQEACRLRLVGQLLGDPQRGGP